MGGGATFVLHQPDPNVIRVAQIANSDPFILQWCARNNKLDAQTLHDGLLNYGKQKFLEKLRAVSDDEVKRLQKLYPEYVEPKLFDHYGIDSAKRNHEAFHYYDAGTGATLYQCSCGLLVFGFSDEAGSLLAHAVVGDGHVKKQTHYREPFPQGRAVEPLSSIHIRLPVTEMEVVESVDGVDVYSETETAPKQGESRDEQ